MEAHGRSCINFSACNIQIPHVSTGYTKHYFAGTEHLASAIGNGGLADIGQPIVDGDVLADKLRERDTLLFRVMAPYPLRINRNRLDTLYSLTRPDTTAELTYFFHPDHLGSASWITDLSGQPVQHLQYKPFGGDYIDQQAPGTDYSERFRFTGKERDAETGFDYFGARYYSSSLGIWLSVDPMSDKYPGLSPYVYCADNPIKCVDPTGNDLEIVINKENKTIIVRANFYYNSSQLEHGDMFNINIKKEFQNAMNIWSENIKTAFSNKQFDGFSVNVQFEWKEVDIGEATGTDAIQRIQQAAEADPIGNSIVHVEKTNPRSEVKGTKHLVANMEKAAADPYMFFGIDGYDGNTAMHEIGHFFGLRDRYDPTNPEHASYIKGDLMSDDMSNRRNAVEPFKRIIEYNNLTPETSKTIRINKDNREPK